MKFKLHKYFRDKFADLLRANCVTLSLHDGKPTDFNEISCPGYKRYSLEGDNHSYHFEWRGYTTINLRMAIRNKEDQILFYTDRGETMPPGSSATLVLDEFLNTKIEIA